jgi:hypothetical protein
MELKKKTSIKRSKPKLRNQKNRDWSWNINNQDGQTIIFKGEEREKQKWKCLLVIIRTTIGDTCHNKRKMTHDTFNDTVERYFWMLGGATRAPGCATHACPFLFFY